MRMKRIGFRLAGALLALAAFSIADARSPAAYQGLAGGSVGPTSGAPVVAQKRRKFRFVEKTCESGCVETYESPGGQQVSLVLACYSGSAEDARRDMQSLIREGRVFQRGWQRNRRGRRGLRTIALYPKDETGRRPAKIFWYHRGDVCFSYIEAGSLKLALEFERSDAAAEVL